MAQIALQKVSRLFFRKLSSLNWVEELGFSQTCEYKSNCSTTQKCTGYARAVRQDDVYQMICKDIRFEVELCQHVFSVFFFSA